MGNRPPSWAPVEFRACSPPACPVTSSSMSISLTRPDVQGIAITMQGKRDQDLLRIDARHDGRGNPYYWLAFARRGTWEPGRGTDLSAIADKRIAVTPLRLNLTDEPFMTRLAQEFSGGGFDPSPAQ